MTYKLIEGQTGAEEVRVLGRQGSLFVVEDASGEFAPPYTLSPKSAAALYGINPNSEPTEALILRGRDDTLTRAGIVKLARSEPGGRALAKLREVLRRNGRSERSPEEQFADAEQEEASHDG